MNESKKDSGKKIAKGILWAAGAAVLVVLAFFAAYAVTTFIVV